jgi:hypothetical protein
MTSATVKPDSGAGGRHAEGRPAYPFWALTIIAVDVVALYGLCAYGNRKEPGSRLAPSARIGLARSAEEAVNDLVSHHPW